LARFRVLLAALQKLVSDALRLTACCGIYMALSSFDLAAFHSPAVVSLGVNEWAFIVLKPSKEVL
jgi:hypothetical protein